MPGGVARLPRKTSVARFTSRDGAVCRVFRLFRTGAKAVKIANLRNFNPLFLLFVTFQHHYFYPLQIFFIHPNSQMFNHSLFIIFSFSSSSISFLNLFIARRSLSPNTGLAGPSLDPTFPIGRGPNIPQSSTHIRSFFRQSRVKLAANDRCLQAAV